MAQDDLAVWFKARGKAPGSGLWTAFDVGKSDGEVGRDLVAGLGRHRGFWYGTWERWMRPNRGASVGARAGSFERASRSMS